jgi:hypothetical protein
VTHGVATADVEGNTVPSVTASSPRMILPEFALPKRVWKTRCREVKSSIPRWRLAIATSHNEFRYSTRS